MRLALRIGVALTALALAAPACAGAAFGPGAALVSVSPDRGEQADSDTVAVDISEDGRYVVFQTRARNLFPASHEDPPGQFRRGGIFRRDLETGALELVALGDLIEQGTGSTVRRGAQNPSINGDGRYVSFSSADQLSAVDVNTRIDVYVRDMDQAIDSPSAFELASARDGSEQPAAYGGSSTAVTGAQVTPESALSADGRRVVFGTQALSDLPAADQPTVPSGQLFVRDLDTRATTLVTRSRADGSPAGGAASSALASISADGSTVVWPGRNAAAQTRLQPGEVDSLVYYLWRRVADGPGTPTRRITGLADIDDPACPESQPIDPGEQTATGPCYGPLSLPEGFNEAISGQLPTMSADGRRVAFQVAVLPRPNSQSGNQLDVFVTDMSSGLTRKASTIELTREIQSDVTNNIQPVKISADGSRIAFVSSRRDFGLPVPRLITPPPANVNKAELYVVDLGRMEIERVTTAWDGTEIDGTVVDSFGAIALSADGSHIAFVSSAANLFPGDSNTAADVFVVSEAFATGGGTALGEPPFDDVTPREDADERAGPVLPVGVRRTRGGLLRVTVRAPQAGRLALTARARVRTGRRVRVRPIARTVKRVRAAGTLTLTLRPASRYRRYVRRQGRLRSRLEVRFSPTGQGTALVARRTVSFTS